MSFAAMAAVLLLAFSTPHINGLAAAAGLFLTNVAVVLTGRQSARAGAAAAAGDVDAD